MNEQMPELKMVEIYGGKDEAWKGWHNLILMDGEDSYSIAGPVHPETSAMLLKAIDTVPRDKVEALIAVAERCVNSHVAYLNMNSGDEEMADSFLAAIAAIRSLEDKG